MTADPSMADAPADALADVLDDLLGELSDLADVLARLLDDARASGAERDERTSSAVRGIAATLLRPLDEQRPHPYDDDPFPLG